MKTPEPVHAELIRVEGKLFPLLAHAQAIGHPYLQTLIWRKISEAQQQLTEWPSNERKHHEGHT